MGRETEWVFPNDPAEKCAKMEAEIVRLRVMIRNEHTEPPNDYGDDISTELAVKLAECEKALDEMHGQYQALDLMYDSLRSALLEIESGTSEYDCAEARLMKANSIAKHILAKY